MAYDIKGDVTVARSLTAGSNITAAGYDLSIPVTAATTGTPLNVDLANGHRSFAMVVDTNSTGNITINDPTNVGVAKTLTLRLTNLDVIARTFTLSSGYVRSDGTAVASITLVAGDTRVFDFTQTKTSPSLVWATAVDTGLALSGGLAKHGPITSDADAGEGIYNMNAVGGAFNFTLPAATGSQKRYVFVGESVATNNTTVKVQAGEALNASINGTYTMSTDGEMILALDASTGKWDITVLGAASPIALHQARASHTAVQNLLAGTWTTIILDTVDYDTGGMVNGAGAITIQKTGLYRVTSNYSNANNALIHQTTIMKNGVSISYDVSTVGTGSMTLSDTNTYQLVAGDVLTLHAYCSVATPVSFASLEILEIPSSETIMAGTVTPTPLGSVSGYRTTILNPGFGTPLPMETVSLSQNITESVLVDGLVLLKAGKSYKIDAGVRLESPNSSFSIWYVQTSTGTKISGRISLDSTNSNTNNASLSSTSLVYKPIADVSIGLYLDAASSLGEAGAGSYISIVELPVSTVVNPGMVVPTPLHRFQANTLINGATLASPTLDFTDPNLTVSDPNVLLVGTTDVVIKQGGVYDISAAFDMSSAGVLPRIAVNGTGVATGATVTAGNQTSLQWSGDLSIGDIVTFTFSSGTISNGSFTLQQLASLSVIRPVDALVTTTALAKMSNTAAQALTPAGAINTLVYDTTNFATGVALVPAAGTMTIGAAGIYEIVMNASVDNSINSASYTVTISVDGAVVASQGVSASIQQLGTIFNVSSGPLNLASGAVVTAEYSTNNANTRTTQGGATVNWISIKQLSGNVVS